MRTSRDQARETRQRILEAAARLFRERGIAAVGVDTVMQAAGLSHGGFYRHFGSKDALAAEALGQAFGEMQSQQAGLATTEEVVSAYLSEAHREAWGAGCAIAALGPEVARLGEEARQSLTRNVRWQVDRLVELEGAKTEHARRRALAMLSAMVGALVLARAVSDSRLSDDILAATSDALLGDASQTGTGPDGATR